MNSQTSHYNSTFLIGLNMLEQNFTVLKSKSIVLCGLPFIIVPELLLPEEEIAGYLKLLHRAYPGTLLKEKEAAELVKLSSLELLSENGLLDIAKTPDGKTRVAILGIDLEIKVRDGSLVVPVYFSEKLNIALPFNTSIELKKKYTKIIRKHFPFWYRLKRSFCVLHDLLLYERALNGKEVKVPRYHREYIEKHKKEKTWKLAQVLLEKQFDRGVTEVTDGPAFH